MEPEDTEDEPFSDYASDIQSSEFTSVNSSRMRHSYEHGRRYQGFLEGRYGIPNDDTEQIREGVKHRLYVDYILGGKMILAPIGNNPHKIVDLGTGVGIWAQDVAEMFPSARIIGTDLSPIQPHWAAPNCEFRVEDLEDDARDWTSIYADSDLIHTRSVLQTLHNPQLFMQRVFENLRPGGWYQLHEVEPMPYTEQGQPWHDHPLARFYRLLEGPFSEKYGWNMRIPFHLRETLEAAGFAPAAIHERPVFVPLGRWMQSNPHAREMGLFNLSIFEDFVTAMLAKHEYMGISADEAEGLANETLAMMHDVRNHAQIKFVNYWAQKPPS